MAPPIGLVLLGAVFDNTPIELRYLSFGLPFIALLVAWAAPQSSDPARIRPANAASSGSSPSNSPASPVCCSSPAPCSPPAPRQARPPTSPVTESSLLPRGNDGVGIVGAFGIEAPPALPILLLRPTDPIASRVAPYHRVVLAVMAQDRDSVGTIPVLRAAFAPPNWRRVAIGSNVEVYERTGEGE